MRWVLGQRGIERDRGLKVRGRGIRRDRERGEILVVMGRERRHIYGFGEG